MTDTEKAKQALDDVPRLLDKYLFESDEVSQDNKQAVEDFFLEQSERFFTAPASSRTDHHSCFPGGLAYHSLKVTENLFRICAGMDIEAKNSSKVIVGLFHDLGKIGNLTQDYYLPNPSEWHRKNLGKMYEMNTERDDDFTVPTRSLRIMEHYGFKFTDEEYFAILYHDGLYVDENRIPAVMYSKNELARAMQFADSWTAFVNGV